MKNSQVFVTLALGYNYARMSSHLIADVLRYSTSDIVVYTDCSFAFKKYLCNSRVHIVPHVKKLGGFFDKYVIIKEVINDYKTCIFLDADVRLASNFPSISGGSGVYYYHSCGNLRHWLEYGKKFYQNANKVFESQINILGEDNMLHESVIIFHDIDRAVIPNLYNSWDEVYTVMSDSGILQHECILISSGLAQNHIPMIQIDLPVFKYLIKKSWKNISNIEFLRTCFSLLRHKPNRIFFKIYSMFVV
jgi:hypothetical protein